MFGPQRLDIWAYMYCHYWKGGDQCKFCPVNLIFNGMLKTDTGID